MNFDLEDIYKRKSMHDLLDFFIHWSESSVPVSEDEFNAKSEMEKNVYLIYEGLSIFNKSKALFRLIQNGVAVQIVKDFDINSDEPCLEIISYYQFQDFRPRIKFPIWCNLSHYNRILFLLPEYEKIMDSFSPDISISEYFEFMSGQKKVTTFNHQGLSRKDFLSGYFGYGLLINKISFSQDMNWAIVSAFNNKLLRKLFYKSNDHWLEKRTLKLPVQKKYGIVDAIHWTTWRDIL